MNCQCSKGDVCDCGLCVDLSAEVNVYECDNPQPWNQRRAVLAIGVVTAVVLLVTFGPAVVEWLRGVAV